MPLLLKFCSPSNQQTRSKGGTLVSVGLFAMETQQNLTKTNSSDD